MTTSGWEKSKRSYLCAQRWRPSTADPDWPSAPICLRLGGKSPLTPAGSAADSCPQAPSPGPLEPPPQLRPAPSAEGAAGSRSGSPHPGPPRCPGACRSHCSPPARTGGLRDAQGCSRRGAVTWRGTAPSTGTWQDSPPSPAQAWLREREEGTDHHTPRQGGEGGEGVREGRWETRRKVEQQSKKQAAACYSRSECLCVSMETRGGERWTAEVGVVMRRTEQIKRDGEMGRVWKSVLSQMSRLSLSKCFIHRPVGVFKQKSHLPFSSP